MIFAGNDPKDNSPANLPDCLLDRYMKESIAALWMWEETEQSKQVWTCPSAWRDWQAWAEGLDPTVKLGIFLNMPGLGEFLRAEKTKKEGR